MTTASLGSSYTDFGLFHLATRGTACGHQASLPTTLWIWWVWFGPDGNVRSARGFGFDWPRPLRSSQCRAPLSSLPTENNNHLRASQFVWKLKFCSTKMCHFFGIFYVCAKLVLFRLLVLSPAKVAVTNPRSGHHLEAYDTLACIFPILIPEYFHH